MEHKLTYRHTITRCFSVRCTCGWLWTAGTSSAAERKGEAHRLAAEAPTSPSKPSEGDE